MTFTDTLKDLVGKATDDRPRFNDLVNPEVTPSTLRELLSYNPKTGDMRWKRRSRKWCKSDGTRDRWNNLYAGKLVSNKTASIAYAHVCVLGTTYPVHRVAYAIAHGNWPDGHIDHINGDRFDNRLSNLRVVTIQENARNTKRPVTNTSGVVGVHWSKAARKWRANIRVDQKLIHLGSFDSKADAVKARAEAERKHGFHSNHGRSA